jgi:SSS family solute:Na+ symporter
VLVILLKRINAIGAIATLIYGLLSGKLRIILELIKDDLSGAAEWFATVNFSHFAIFNFLACAAVCTIVSLLTPKPSEEQIKGLTLGTLSAEQRQANRDSYSKTDVVISVVLAAVVISILVYFRG